MASTKQVDRTATSLIVENALRTTHLPIKSSRSRAKPTPVKKRKFKKGTN